MSFSRLLQNAPFYSPAAFSPSRRQQRQDGSSPSASSSSLPAFDRRRRTKASRPLVDPYAALPAPEFDNFVDDVSSRIVNALTYEPNRDRRVRRGYADDDEYWMEMGGKPGEFVGNLTQDLESEHVEETLQDAQAEPEDEEERSQEDQAIDAETGREVPAQQELNSERHLYDDEPSAIPIDTSAIDTTPVNLDNQYAQQPGLYPDLSALDENGSSQAASSIPVQQDIQISAGRLYPSLKGLQAETAAPPSLDGNYQLDLLQQLTSGEFQQYAAGSPSNEEHLLHQQGISHQQSQTIEDLLDLAEQDAREANEAIMHLQEEEEREQKLDDELLEELEREEREGSDVEMQEDAEMDEDIAIPSDEEGQEGLFEDEQHNGPALRLPPSKQKSTSRETSEVISIGSTSDEEEESAEIDDEEEEEGEEEDEEPIDLDAEEDVNDEEEEESDLEFTPPPISASQIASSQAPVIPVSGPSIQLFGQLDAPIPSQSRLMSQKIRRRMDEDDLRTSGFDEQEEGVRSGSSDASDEHAREWQQFRRKIGKGQRAQDEQDAADRYFNDEDEEEAYPRGSENEEEDEDEEESDEDALSEEDYATRTFRKLSKRAAQGEFEDEIDDETIADQERQVKRSKADLDERVPVPAFMKLDKETGEYELRTGTSSEEEESEEDDEGEEQEAPIVTEVDQANEDIQIEVLAEEDITVELEEDATVEAEENIVVEEIITTEPENGVEEMVDAVAAEDRNQSAIPDEIVDLVHSDADASLEVLPQPSGDTGINISKIIAHSMEEHQTPLASLEALPPLPQALADVAEQLIDDAVDASNNAGSGPAAAEEAEPTADQALAAPEMRQKSREPSIPARTPRKSAEPKLFSSIAVSPEQFSLSPRLGRAPSVTPAVPSASDAAVDPAVQAAQSEAASGEADQTAEAPIASLRDELPTSFGDKTESAAVEGSEEDMTTKEEPDIVDTAEAPIIADESTNRPMHFTEDHHHEPPPPELQEEKHFSGEHAGSRTNDQMASVDLTTDEMESHSADEADEAQGKAPEHHFTEDHHHEPPPPELQEERHFTSEHAGLSADDEMAGIDLTTDEMEAHSADEAEEPSEKVLQHHFNEDHHFEPPPSELQDDLETSDDKVLDKEDPLAGVDMTTDEMEAHSAGEDDERPVHEIGYKEAHVFEPPVLPSETEQEAPVIIDEALTARDESVETTAPAERNVPADVPSEAAQPEVPAPQSGQEASPEKTEKISVEATSEKPADTKTSLVSPQQQKATPSRKFNAIKPGLWDPSTPIRFGGTSLEAAIREAYYDHERSANLKKTLEIEDDDDASTSADKSTVDDGSMSTIVAGKASRHVGFVPLDDDAEMKEAGDEHPDENDAVAAEVLPARISSPGIKGEDGDLTETVLEADFIGDPVSDVLAEDSELPPLEPEVLETIEASDKASSEESATPAPQSSSASAIEYEELQEAVQASTSAQPEGAASPVRELLASSDESDDDDHHIASTLLRSKAQPVATASKSTPKARRGRSRTRQAATSIRKGKERAEPESEAEDATPYTEDEQIETKDSLTESAAAEEVARGRATTPQKDSTGRNIVTAFIVPGSPIAATTPMEELEVSAMLAPRPSQPRFHRHGTSGSIHVLSPPARKRKLSPSSRSSASRTSAEPVLGSSAAPVHPDAEHPSHQGTLNVSGSPIQTRSQCTYRKLMIPNPYMGSINTPGRRISTRLARAAGGAESNNEEYPSSFVFLVPGCVTADRKEQMQEGGIVDLGVASVEEEGSAMALQASEENDLGLHVEGLPDSVVQSLVRVVGLEMFREGDCEILSPLIPQGAASPARNGNGNGTERKRRRESEMMSPPGTNKRLR